VRDRCTCHWNGFRSESSGSVFSGRAQQAAAQAVSAGAAQDASAEDLARCDGICIICREEMAPAGRNKKLPCSHVFHLHCLRRARQGPAQQRACSGSSTGLAVGPARGLQWALHGACSGSKPLPPSALVLSHCLRSACQGSALRGACRRLTAPPPSSPTASHCCQAPCVPHAELSGMPDAISCEHFTAPPPAERCWGVGRSWLERQQNCPICRTSVLAPRPADAAAAASQPARPSAPHCRVRTAPSRTPPRVVYPGEHGRLPARPHRSGSRAPFATS